MEAYRGQKKKQNKTEFVLFRTILIWLDIKSRYRIIFKSTCMIMVPKSLF